MDARRLLTGAAALWAATCGLAQAAPVPDETPAAAPQPSPAAGTMAPIPNPALRDARPARRTARSAGQNQAVSGGRSAIAAANLSAREPSRPDRFVGGLQLFTYGPGRIYEIWAAPLRVTTLTLGPGESLVSMAAGDTVRWQIGETSSGQGPGRRTHVLLKPLERGLETNLVVTTSERLYELHLRSGDTAAFNTAVAWDPGVLEPTPITQEPAAAAQAPPQIDASRLDAGYRVSHRGRRPAWTPSAVMTDGIRTFIAFPPQMASSEAPALFVIAPDGEAQMVNYRQQGGLFVVDRVFESAELRLGDRRAQVVRINRLTGARP